MSAVAHHTVTRLSLHSVAVAALIRARRVPTGALSCAGVTPVTPSPQGVMRPGVSTTTSRTLMAARPSRIACTSTHAPEKPRSAWCQCSHTSVPCEPPASRAADRRASSLAFRPPKVEHVRCCWLASELTTPRSAPSTREASVDTSSVRRLGGCSARLLSRSTNARLRRYAAAASAVMEAVAAASAVVIAASAAALGESSCGNASGTVEKQKMMCPALTLRCGTLRSTSKSRRANLASGPSSLKPCERRTDSSQRSMMQLAPKVAAMAARSSMMTISPRVEARVCA